ncbi:centromere protein M [Protopterus annectens]|uniref:centromere protein M n=1 Tax=Protopterus annectens TaxID=7888 RepID=UPI001CFA123F|nr:centromere protein M [Protopterus annectens]
MAVGILKAYEKMPMLNSACILLIGSDIEQQQQLADAILKEERTFRIKIHLATSLPLPSSMDALRPRIDLVVFLINLHSKKSLTTVEMSLPYLDKNLFIGKVYFLATGAARREHCSVEMYDVKKLADAYCSPVFFMELESEKSRSVTAERLIEVLRIAAGHVQGMSSVFLSSLLMPFHRDSDDF